MAPAGVGEWPDWMDDSEVAFSEVMDRMRKVVASGTLDAVDWNAELIRGDVLDAVRRLKEQPGRGVALGGVKLPATLAAHGLTGSSTSSPLSCIRSSRGADHYSSMASAIRSTSSWSSSVRSARARSCNATGPSLSKGPELVTTLEAAVTSTDSVFIESVNSEPGGLS